MSHCQSLRPFARAIPVALALLMVWAWVFPGQAAPGQDKKVSDVLAERAQANPAGKLDVIVSFRTPPGLLDKNDIGFLGGNVKRHFRSLPAVALSLPAPAVESLARRPNVTWVTRPTATGRSPAPRTRPR
jgi:hypothetical protein